MMFHREAVLVRLLVAELILGPPPVGVALIGAKLVRDERVLGKGTEADSLRVHRLVTLLDQLLVQDREGFLPQRAQEVNGRAERS